MMPISLDLVTKLFFFSFTLWLGAYLLTRNISKPVIYLTGFGLIAYVITLLIELLTGQLIMLLLLLPAILWIGTVLHLLPDELKQRELYIRIWILSIIPVIILTLVEAWFSIIVVLSLLLSAGMVAKLALRSRFKNTLGVLAVVVLFFGLSTGLMVLPFDLIPRTLGISLLGADIIMLGIVITLWDAFDEGETIRAHLLRSFIAAFYYAGALAAMVIIFIALAGETNFSSLLLLTCLIAFGILTQTFSTQIQSFLDKLIFSPSSKLSREREILRAAADELPRLSTLELAEVDEIAFTRLTRRAISNLGNLPKLAASPLTKLSIITSQSGDNPLDRAHALKALLIESIQRLKPQNDADFGITDEWRYFNALYFPYVMGLKPYARRIDKEFLDEETLQILEWFQVSVPERTLYNWQNIAARLVAEDLRNKN
ncbi:MAG: hypothetical protein HN855_10165 [Anaerolineae bacterium]|jgi:hypothetical protein|nr:hypothetical protein [Anaerolineae bacterium]MBT7071411.1 hypothetical protein [Anaerolineae bacterium]MBT7325515.1 hypothetical protein [Anaerolineae bacterium]